MDMGGGDDDDDSDGGGGGFDGDFGPGDDFDDPRDDVRHSGGGMGAGRPASYPNACGHNYGYAHWPQVPISIGRKHSLSLVPSPSGSTEYVPRLQILNVPITSLPHGWHADASSRTGFGYYVAWFHADTAVPW